MSILDPVELSQSLIRCPSVTPADEGALGVLEEALSGVGFTCHRLPFSEAGTPDVDNLYARIGTKGRNFCFAGHTDVVPIGNRDDWSIDPFGGQIREGNLFGRGASDMKCAIACFAAAAARFIDKRGGDFDGSISFLITGDEEGPAINGTPKMLGWMSEQGETMDDCLVGEPTNTDVLGDTIKIGRRGSINAHLIVYGTQGHVAYPHLADNPAPKLLKMLSAIDAAELDEGSEHFPPSNLEITSIDIANEATNVIPAKAEAAINIRFNDHHSGASLEQKLRDICDEFDVRYGLECSVSGESFLTPPGALSDLINGAVESVTGRTASLSTSGGTSDARFIKDFCPVAEFGLSNATAHKVDENVPVDDVRALSDIYESILETYFPE
ncbi:MAG: succinyl-diaminopimelate desuccinylase [Rhodospirillaceae bacterium]|jgi:succinyl-diaminopimelate desuccinylase|nr:succinyl-diaminopimelate desuccinylase [Rhodospirillaceae bacterium]MBT4463776.1 succinyl-diaminopimelate desuccinylase [Rhodospirillaceae bacterium]MBT5013587.1 succinyl-diaminopimelate desuccinylase [Rhodospirillaceae bacterium]MBT5308907.1 succinyl-diaminopimelate desuccinylase [Rhodospirillaceae bacterium]MBT7355457.1 succinyl-diaminopimelate desuccinylase [Rhodospirillaceae bacterium]